MKHLTFTGLLVLVLSTLTAPVLAKTEGFNAALTGINSTPRITPFELASLANAGYFRDQGIPSYAALNVEYRLGRISAKDIVQAAIEANRLPANVVDDQDYINVVDRDLKAIETFQ